ncbi:MAG TPA: radical SAM protein [Candidatus Merdivicinus excrementipullorum]|uniref:Radical SAM protein n=1 Tax=Candidatus Merdivicinus excrementipullorum TaxID=2840867 RepID=A0A9D1K031_9FIRM|nr:radical SAM protein [Candidatus Merdivicinus excrementipullorum]
MELLKECRLCPRECGVNRLEGQRGRCGAVGETVKVARAALHYWEEPCISGSRGSGAVFFSYCPLGCVYCQNREISRGDAGKEIAVSRLAEIFLELQGKQAHNINLVTPTHYVPQIILALREAKEKGLSIPVVFNCGGYEKPETLKLLEGLVDVWLPDFKYVSTEHAAKYSGAADYLENAKAALSEMVRQAGKPVFDIHGIMTRGVIVRHLVLPGMSKESKKILRYLHRTYGDRIYLSIMSQFTPLENVRDYPEIDRTVTESEYENLLDFAVNIGIENAYIQEGGTADESFIPPFDCEGV